LSGSQFAAVSELTAGYNDPTVNWSYRHHATQLSRQENWWRNNAGEEKLASGWWLQDDTA
jgi:hypothetical protein